MSVQPRCPFCNAQGLEAIAAKSLGTFSLICCSKCGAIHGIAPFVKPPTSPRGGPYGRHKKQSPTEAPERVNRRAQMYKDRLPKKPQRSAHDHPTEKIEFVLDASPDGLVSYAFAEEESL